MAKTVRPDDVGEQRKSDKSQAEQPGAPALDRKAQARIGNTLRAMYGELAEQPVPDRLTALLDRIVSREG